MSWFCHPAFGTGGAIQATDAGAAGEHAVGQRPVVGVDPRRELGVERGQAVAAVPSVVDDVPRRDHQHHDVGLELGDAVGQLAFEPVGTLGRPRLPPEELALATRHEAAPFGDDHLDLCQLGVGGRPLDQTG